MSKKKKDDLPTTMYISQRVHTFGYLREQIAPLQIEIPEGCVGFTLVYSDPKFIDHPYMTVNKA